MRQVITISDRIVDFFLKYLPTIRSNDATLLIDCIEQNFVADTEDKLQFQKYFKKIDSIQDQQKRNAFGEIFKNWMETSYKKIESSSDSLIIEEYDISNKSNDKIFLITEITEKEINKLLKQNHEIEFHNEKSFVMPQHYHRLKNLPLRYKLEKDICYNLCKILEPFFRDANLIKIIDPYIYNDNAFKQFTSLFDIIKQPTVLEIVSLSVHKYINKNEREDKKKDKVGKVDKFNNFIKEKRNQGYNISLFEFLTSKHKDRYIDTNEFQIYIPGGLDFLDENNIPVLDDEYEKKEIRVDKL